MLYSYKSIEGEVNLNIKWPGQKEDRPKTIFAVEYVLAGIITSVAFFVISNLIVQFTGRTWGAINFIVLIAVLLSSALCISVQFILICAIIFGEYPPQGISDFMEEYLAGNDDVRLFADYLKAGPMFINIFALFGFLLLANIGAGLFQPVILIFTVTSGIFAYWTVPEIKKTFLDKSRISLNHILQGVVLEVLMVIMPLAIFIFQ